MFSYNEVLKRQAILSEIIANAFDKLSGTELETMSVVFEEDHFHMLLESLKEVKQGKIVSFKEAFSDLD